MKRLWYWLGGVLAVLLTVALALFLIWDWNWFTPWLAAQATSRSSRTTTIGSLDVDWNWSAPRVVLTDVHVANPEWARQHDMFTAKRVVVAIKLAPLFSGTIGLADVELDHPVVDLETDGHGNANWQPTSTTAGAAAAQGTVPKSRGEVPVIDRLRIVDGKLSYLDPARGIDLDSEVATALGNTAGSEVKLDGHGHFEGMTFRLMIQGGSLTTLRDTGKPYPLEIDATIGQTHGHAKGTVREPLDAHGFDLTMQLSGDDMAEIFPIFGIPLPNTRPYSLTGRLGHTGTTWSFDNFNGKVGNSDLSGDLKVDTSGDKPTMSAELTSKELDFSDLSGFIGAAPKKQNPKVGIFPATPINLERLRAMNMQVHYTAGRDQDVGLRARPHGRDHRRQGRRRHDRPLRLGIAGGTMAGSLQARRQPRGCPSADARVHDPRVEVKQFFRDSKFAQQMGGNVDGRIDLRHGQVARRHAGVSNGRLALMTQRGTISADMVELAGLDVAEYSRSRSRRATCGSRSTAAPSTSRQGRRGDLEDPDARHPGLLHRRQGHGRFRRPDLHLAVQAHPKDTSPLTFNGPIYLTARSPARASASRPGHHPEDRPGRTSVKTIESVRQAQGAAFSDILGALSRHRALCDGEGGGRRPAHALRRAVAAGPTASRWSSCTAAPAAADPRAAPLLRPAALPHRALRPARLRPLDAARVARATTRPGTSSPTWSAAAPPRHRALAGVRRLVGQHARARVRRAATPSA